MHQQLTRSEELVDGRVYNSFLDFEDAESYTK